MEINSPLVNPNKGRNIFPFFDRIADSPSTPLPRASLRAIVLGHLQAIYAFHGEESGLRIARKHLGWYGRLLTPAPDARAQFMTPDSTAAQFAVAESLFDAWVDETDVARQAAG